MNKQDAKYLEDKAGEALMDAMFDDLYYGYGLWTAKRSGKEAVVCITVNELLELLELSKKRLSK